MRVLGVVALALVGCSHPLQPKEPTSEDTIATAPVPPPPVASAPVTTSLRRSDVHRTVANGMGAFLQNVAVEDNAVMRDGKFHGFRIVALNPSWNVDLAPGDVVTGVNGLPIGLPDEAVAALRSVEKAAALRVDYERHGRARTLTLSIVDDQPANAAR